ncbi:MAG: TldD/PmbA family protein [Betaproteobacteria bacterium]|nr:MAG: TldD/PmbA family protein [Betaproteobacteria bacterium]
MKDQFFYIADALAASLHAGETLLASFHGERSDFVRFNHAKVRQAGSVEQRYVTLRLVRSRRQASASVAVAGDGFNELKQTLLRLRDALASLPEDPWLLINETPQSGASERRGRIAPAQEIVDVVTGKAAALDLVGFYAGGTICRGFANSLGQRNWHEVDSFNFDWSLYREADRAVKTGYAGFEWDDTQFAAKLETAKEQLSLLNGPRRGIEPGEYRAYLAPRAMEDLVGLLSWGGFSARSRATKQSPLLRMQEGERLSEKVSIAESTAEGVAPGFQCDGFVKPAGISLIAAGTLDEALVSPRSAKEYGLATNAAGAGEMPESLDMAAGELPASEALAGLDRGLYVSNLWYLNFSDRPAGRITGMTRFATFWVEGGRVLAPVSPMRFDDSIYRMLGGNLLALTREREFLLDPSTYDERSTASARLPGALLRGLRFTL